VADGLRVVLRHGARLADLIDSSVFRQHAHLSRRGRRLVLNASRIAASQRHDRAARLGQAVGELCDFAEQRCTQAGWLSDQYRQRGPGLDMISAAQAKAEHERLMSFVALLATCIHCARERLVLGNRVDHQQRVYSIFEPHTEMVYRGKARAKVEFGHRVLIAEDAAGFIIDAQVMPSGQQDREAAVPLVEKLRNGFPDLTRVSFDRGFHSPDNHARLAEILPDSCLPNSGAKALAKQAESASVSWTWQRRRHAGIEAAIGSLQDNRGCRRCPDKGRKGYDRFLQAAVLANNLITYGRLLWAQDNPDALPARTRRQCV
jgi:hypothetical protein